MPLTLMMSNEIAAKFWVEDVTVSAANDSRGVQNIHRTSEGKQFMMSMNAFDSDADNRYPDAPPSTLATNQYINLIKLDIARISS